MVNDISEVQRGILGDAEKINSRGINEGRPTNEERGLVIGAQKKIVHPLASATIPTGCMHPNAVTSINVPCGQLSKKTKKLLCYLSNASSVVVGHSLEVDSYDCQIVKPSRRFEHFQIHFMAETAVSDKKAKARMEGDKECKLGEGGYILFWRYSEFSDEQGNKKYTDIEFNYGKDLKVPRKGLLTPKTGLIPNRRDQISAKEQAHEWLSAFRSLEQIRPIWEALKRDNPALELKLDSAAAAIRNKIDNWEPYSRDRSDKGGWEVLGQAIDCKKKKVIEGKETESTSLSIDVSDDIPKLLRNIKGLNLTCAFPQRIEFKHNRPKKISSSPKNTLADSYELLKLDQLGKDLLQAINEHKGSIRIILRGYADQSGEETYNKNLSRLRTRWIERLLYKRYKIPRKIKIKRYGCGEKFAPKSPRRHRPSRTVIATVELGS